eukprot:scaffold14752_cov95-Isochrysis_galbana.AAC.1
MGWGWVRDSGGRTWDCCGVILASMIKWRRPTRKAEQPKLLPVRRAGCKIDMNVHMLLKTLACTEQ